MEYPRNELQKFQPEIIIMKKQSFFGDKNHRIIVKLLKESGEI